MSDTADAPDTPRDAPLVTSQEDLAQGQADLSTKFGINENSLSILVSSIEDLSTNAQHVAERSTADRKLQAQGQRLLKWNAVLTIFSIISIVSTLVVLSFSLRTQHSVKSTQDSIAKTQNFISDCIVSSGQCAQKSQRVTAVAIQRITYQTEAQRLADEIQVAKSLGLAAAAAERQRLLAVDEANIQATNRIEEDIIQDRDPTKDPTAQLTPLPDQ